MKKFAAVAVAAMLGASALLGMSACGRDEGTLVIGYTLYAPMNYKDENDKLIGFDTEFAEKACAELGYTPKFVLIDWENKINELNSKNIDLIWNGMTISDDLKESMAISDPYMENKQVVVAKADALAKYTDIASLAQAASIAVESGSAGQSVAEDSGLSEKLNKMTAQANCLLEAMTGEGTDYADLGYVDVGFTAEEYGIGMRKGDTELLASLNGIIAKYKTDGTFDALIAKYMV